VNDVLRSWTPAGILVLGLGLTFGIGQQRSLPLTQPLEAVVPFNLDGYAGQDIVISTAEAEVAGFSDYLMRVYVSTEIPGASGSPAVDPAGDRGEDPAAADTEGEEGVPAALGGGVDDWFTLYVGYYPEQMQGSTIHSPRNCLPGAGWDPLANEPTEVRFADGSTAVVNRYILQREDERTLVLYWYQGRGRIQANEYAVKLDLLRDAALQRRSDEALVRLVIPIRGDEADAHELGLRLAATVAPMVENALPGSDV
jgi:EpsI family protein